jgi:hypothetical protein
MNRSQCLREARGPDSGAGTEQLTALALNQRGRVHSPQSHLALKRFHATKTRSDHAPHWIAAKQTDQLFSYLWSQIPDLMP